MSHCDSIYSVDSNYIGVTNFLPCVALYQKELQVQCAKLSEYIKTFKCFTAAQKCIQEEAHFENFPAEHFNSQDCDLLSPVEDGLEGERHLVQIDLMTPGPNNPDGIGMKDQEAILAGVSPTILELGDTPETSVAERGRQADPVSVSLSCASDYKQVTLPIHHMLFPASDQGKYLFFLFAF